MMQLTNKQQESRKGKNLPHLQKKSLKMNMLMKKGVLKLEIIVLYR